MEFYFIIVELRDTLCYSVVNSFYQHKVRPFLRFLVMPFHHFPLCFVALALNPKYPCAFTKATRLDVLNFQF